MASQETLTGSAPALVRLGDARLYGMRERGER